MHSTPFCATSPLSHIFRTTCERSARSLTSIRRISHPSTQRSSPPQAYAPPTAAPPSLSLHLKSISRGRASSQRGKAGKRREIPPGTTSRSIPRERSVPPSRTLHSCNNLHSESRATASRSSFFVFPPGPRFVDCIPPASNHIRPVAHLFKCRTKSIGRVSQRFHG